MCLALFRNACKLAGIVIVEPTGKQYWHTPDPLLWNGSLLSMGMSACEKKICEPSYKLISFDSRDFMTFTFLVMVAIFLLGLEVLRISNRHSLLIIDLF